MVVKAKTYFDPENPDDFREIGQWLDLSSKRMKRKYDETVKRELPDEPVLIRADQNTPFKFVQKLMELCGKQTISIWKLQLAAKEPEKSDAPSR